MYQALYRKWRPRDFSDVVGQEHITETLRQQVASGRISHAYLFVGTRGTGKTTCAKILAKAANCEHPVDGNPCNECASCVGIDNGSILDVEELDAASNNGVDNIRVIRDEAVFTPATTRYRVYIIDEVHMLSTSAFNALLKILEEPPEHLIFILATTEIRKVPATILSRCQRYSFKRITARDIAHRMAYIAECENIELTSDAAEILARLADGSMRDGLSLLDQCVWDKPIDTERVLSAIGLAGAENTAKLFGYIAESDAASALKLLDELYMDGRDVSSVLEELCTLCRDALITKVAPTGGEGLYSGAFSERALKEAVKTPAERLFYMVKTIQAALSDINRSTDRKIPAELCIMELCDERLSDDISSLAARISRLETGGMTGARVLSESEHEAQAGAQNTAAVKHEESAKAPDDRAAEKPKAADEDDLPWDIPAVRQPVTDKAERKKTVNLQENISAPADAKSKAAEREKDGDIKNPAQAAEAGIEPRAAQTESGGKAAQPPARADTGDKAQPPAGQSPDAAWKSILAIVEKQIDIAPYSFLSDKAHAEGELSGNTLTIATKNIIARSMIEAEPVTTALKAAAEQVAGRPIVVKVVEYKTSAENAGKKNSKLDELRKFGNIEFK